MIFGRIKPEATPLDGIDVVLADLDGVVYAGPGALPHAVESLNRAQAEGKQLGYITNNASRTDASVAAHLSSLGVRVQPSDVTTSPQTVDALLRPYAATEMECYPVSTAVNTVRNETAACLDRVEEFSAQMTLAF